MNDFCDLIIRLIKKDVSDLLTSEKDPIRILFSGIPEKMLLEIFFRMKSEGEQVEFSRGNIKKYIPVFLVDTEITDDSTGLNSGRCSHHHLVSVRNTHEASYLALHSIDSVTNLSSETTAIRKGLSSNNYQSLQSWLKEPFVESIMDEIYSNYDAKDSKKIRDVFIPALREAWEINQSNRDRRNLWDIVVVVYESSLVNNKWDYLCEVLGLPCIEGNDVNQALSVTPRISEYFMVNGFETGRELLVKDIPEASDIPNALTGFIGAVAINCLTSADFHISPMKNYALAKSHNSNSSEWWWVLTDNVWDNLIGGVSRSQITTEITVTCSNKLYSAVSNGHPDVVQGDVEFRINSSEGCEEVSITVKRASGNKTLEEIDIISVGDDPITYTDKNILGHDRFIKYQFISDVLPNPINRKVISLSTYKPKVTVNCRSSTKISQFKFKPSKSKKARLKGEGHYECDIEVRSVGTHTLDIYQMAEIKLGLSMSVFSSNSVNNDESEPVAKNITPSSGAHAVCLIEVDEECFCEFIVQSLENKEKWLYRINIIVGDSVPKGVSSELRKLIVESCDRIDNLKVNVRHSLLLSFEYWILSNKASYNPVILGPGMSNKWRVPEWGGKPIISDCPLYLDPRPTLDPPKRFVECREKLRELLKTHCDEKSDSIESLNLGMLFLEPSFKTAITDYIDQYYKWLKKDYESAIWCDILTIHSKEPGTGTGKSCLKSIPDAVILSPFHPAKIAWQCNAQNILNNALQNGCASPAASNIDPSVFPDCMVLPCLNANDRSEPKGFASIRTSSDYWSVLWNVDLVAEINDDKYNTFFSEEFGLTIDGIAQGFSFQQVKCSLDVVRDLESAKSTLTLSLISDTNGHSSCNDGIEEWCEQNMGIEKDEWAVAGANSLHVYDTREIGSQPEPAILAKLTAYSGGNVRWYSKINSREAEKRDLTIIDHLKTMNNSFERHRFNSAIDPTCLYRVSIKHNLKAGKFLAQSRVGSYICTAVEEDQSLNNILQNVLSKIETSCEEHDLFDCLVFAPNLQTLNDSLHKTNFCAVSSSIVDASCFHLPDQSSLLWDYDLPKYSSAIGQTSGFYLLAQESANIRLALNSALNKFQEGVSRTELQAKNILNEISLRGMPTLKKITGGGTSGIGEIGMLVVLRLLQTEFQNGAVCAGLIPVINGSRINIIIPADIFKPRFDSLRSLYEKETLERPDLLVMSIEFINGHDEVALIRITPIEVKSRATTMSSMERAKALKQASNFSKFLMDLKNKSYQNELWGVAWREMLISWVDYGFRVYGEVSNIKKTQPNWSQLHQTTIMGLMDRKIEIDIDEVGRLVSLEKGSHTQFLETGGQSFKDTVILSRISAAGLLSDNQESVINEVRNKVKNWRMEANVEELMSINSSSQSKNVNHLMKKNGADNLETKNKINQSTSDKDVSESSDFIEDQNQHMSCVGIKFKVGESLDDRFGKKDIVFYPGNTALNNINIGVVGDLGTGKTQMLKSMVYQLISTPEQNRGIAPKVLILDYKKDFSDLNDKDCQFIKKANVKIIKPKDIPLNMFNTQGCSSAAPWLERYSFFRDILGKIFSSKGPVQDANLKKAVKNCFSRLEGKDPTIYQVFDEYEKIVGGKVDSIYGILSDINDYKFFERDPDKIISFDQFFDGVVAIDLNDINDNKLKNMIIVIFLNFYYEYMMRIKKRKFLGENPQTRFIDSFLLVDEAHNIMPYEFSVLSKLLLQGRQFGVGVILASQYFTHFKTSRENYIEPINSWFVHKVPGMKGSDMDRIGLPSKRQDEIARISSLQMFESLCKTLDYEGEFMTGIPFYKLD